MKTVSSLRQWLLLATVALALAGLFSILVVVARIPALEPYAGKSYFYTALVGHVDFSLVVWFVLLEMVLWRHVLGESLARFERPAFLFCTLGVLVAGIAALSGKGTPVLSHYVPYIRNVWFSVGLIIFAVGTALMAVPAAWHGLRQAGRSAVSAGVGVSALAIVAVLLSLVFAGARLTGSDKDAELVIRALFWGSGHILQFAHVVAMVTIWQMLLERMGGAFANKNLASTAIYLYVPGIISGLWATAVMDPIELTVNPLMSNVMAYGLGIPTGAVALLVLMSVIASWRDRSGWGDATVVSVWAGMFVFAIGGAIAIKGLMEQNLRIPAHYHGVLGAVALSFMGYTYHLLALYFKQGYSAVMARWQPYIYVIGVLGFVAGMGWAGDFGAPRKTPGFDWVQDPVVFIAMNIMGVGAFFAAAGGAIYVLIAGKALLPASNQLAHPAAKGVLGCEQQ